METRWEQIISEATGKDRRGCDRIICSVERLLGGCQVYTLLIDSKNESVCDLAGPSKQGWMSFQVCNCLLLVYSAAHFCNNIYRDQSICLSAGAGISSQMGRLKGMFGHNGEGWDIRDAPINGLIPEAVFGLCSVTLGVCAVQLCQNATWHCISIVFPQTWYVAFSELRHNLMYLVPCHMGLHHRAAYQSIQQPGDILPLRQYMWSWLSCPLQGRQAAILASIIRWRAFRQTRQPHLSWGWKRLGQHTGGCMIIPSQALSCAFVASWLPQTSLRQIKW